MTLKQIRLARRVKKLTLQGLRQSEIAQVLRVSKLTVRGYQREQGLPTKVKQMVPAGESLAQALHSLDGLYPTRLPWGPELDPLVADLMLARFKEQHPKLFARTPKYAVAENRAMLCSAMNVKRACYVQGRTVN